MSRDALQETLPLTLSWAFVRYAGVGAIGTAVHYAVLVVLVQFANVTPISASTVGAVAGAIVNYALNHRFTFVSQRKHILALPRFMAITGLGILVNAAVMALVLAVVTDSYLIAQVIATGVVLIVGYVANKKWTF